MFTIGEVTDRTGVSVHARRYYERHGLLAGYVARTSSGHRRHEAHVHAEIDALRSSLKLISCKVSF